MIMYEYRCIKCKHIFEELVSSADEQVNCTDCQQPCQRILSATKGFLPGTDNPVKLFN